MEKPMSVDALWSPERQQETSAQAAALQRPPDCPLALCAAIERGQKELEGLNRTEAKLREALAREKVLLDEKDRIDEAQRPYEPRV